MTYAVLQIAHTTTYTAEWFAMGTISSKLALVGGDHRCMCDRQQELNTHPFPHIPIPLHGPIATSLGLYGVYWCLMEDYHFCY